MADTKISAESAASALDGTELLAGVQSAANVKITTAQVKTLAIGTPAAGKVLQGATPAFTYTPALGVAGTATGTISFAGVTSGVVTVQPASAAGTWSLTLPTTAGTSNYFLQTNGSGVTTWAAGGGGATLAANTFTGVQTLPAGSDSAPSLNVGTSTSGFYRPSQNNNWIAWTVGTESGAFVQAGITLVGNGFLSWSDQVNTFNGSSIDTGIKRGAAGVVFATLGETSTKGQFYGATLRTDQTAVASLPAASTAGAGARAFVTDALTTLALGLGTTIANGGSNKVPVYSDGTNWIYG